MSIWVFVNGTIFFYLTSEKFVCAAKEKAMESSDPNNLELAVNQLFLVNLFRKLQARFNEDRGSECTSSSHIDDDCSSEISLPRDPREGATQPSNPRKRFCPNSDSDMEHSIKLAVRRALATERKRAQLKIENAVLKEKCRNLEIQLEMWKQKKDVAR